MSKPDPVRSSGFFAELAKTVRALASRIGEEATFFIICCMVILAAFSLLIAGALVSGDELLIRLVLAACFGVVVFWMLPQMVVQIGLINKRRK